MSEMIPPRKDKLLRLAMLGMIPGNGHPYSWSAIVNGYEVEAMRRCPYAAIPEYLERQPIEDVRIPGAQVTHLWTDDPAEAPLVASAAKIPYIVSKPEEVIGQVDAVIISTDDGDDHVRRVRPFVEAGLPVFVDKPLATSVADLAQFEAWIAGGKRILSSSGMRYSPEIPSSAAATANLGALRWVTSVTVKTWERYGIHALEAVYPLLGSGFVEVRMDRLNNDTIATIIHRSGAQLTITVLSDAYGSFGSIHLYGTKGQSAITLADTYSAFRAQLVAFIDFLRTGVSPIPFAETREMMLILIAGIQSRERGGLPVKIAEIETQLATTQYIRP